MNDKPGNAPGGHQAQRPITARSLLQSMRERDMAEGEARVSALLRRHA